MRYFEPRTPVYVINGQRQPQFRLVLREAGGTARQSGVAHACATRVFVRRRTREVVQAYRGGGARKVWWIEMFSKDKRSKQRQQLRALYLEFDGDAAGAATQYHQAKTGHSGGVANGRGWRGNKHSGSPGGVLPNVCVPRSNRCVLAGGGSAFTDI